MKSFNKTTSLLLRRAKLLSPVAKDLVRQLKRGSLDLEKPFFCRGLNAEITPLEAVVYFLTCFAEWEAIFTRYKKLFPHVLETSWRLSSYEESFNDLFLVIRGNWDLIKLISAYYNQILITDSDSQPKEHETHLSNGSYSANDPETIIEELLLLDDILNVTSQLGEGGSFRGVIHEHVNGLFQPTERTRARIREIIDSLTSDNRQIIISCLQRYRHTLLQYSFLASNHLMSYLLNITPENNSNNMIQIYRDSENSKGLETLNKILARLQEMTSGRSYKDILHGLEDGLAETLAGGEPVNIIPGNNKGVCASVLVAFSSGKGKAESSFSSTLFSINEHLSKCSPGNNQSGVATRVVAIICDHWDSSELNKFFGAFAAAHARGVKFVFLLQGSDRGNPQLSEIKVNFR
jgi:hypothetical protein